MSENYQFPSGTNVFVPQIQSQLLVDYTLNQNEFPLVSYVDLVPVDLMKGYYRKFSPDPQARDVNSPADHQWADGNDAPAGTYNNLLFELPSYTTSRLAYPWRAGWLTVNQASWDYIAMESGHQAHRAMVDRTNRVASVLQTSASYPTGNTNNATSLAGGQWSNATSTNPYIKISIQKMVSAIVKATNGKVQYPDLHLIVSPDVADVISYSQEMIDQLKQTPNTLEQIEGKAGWAKMWGLPSSLYGVDLIVDFTNYVSTQPVTGSSGASGTRAFAFSSTAVVMCTKQRVVGGPTGANFSTLSLFSYTPDEMATEVHNDELNRRYNGRVIVNDSPVLVAAESGYYLTGVA